MEKLSFYHFFLLLSISFLCFNECSARHRYHHPTKLDIFRKSYDRALLNGITSLEDYEMQRQKEDEVDEYSGHTNSKKGIGGIASFIVDAVKFGKAGTALRIGNAIINGASLSAAITRVAFDAWFLKNKCCGPQPQYCINYQAYVTARDQIISYTQQTDTIYGNLDQKKTWVDDLSTKMGALSNSMDRLDRAFKDIVYLLQPGYVERIKYLTSNLTGNITAQKVNFENNLANHLDPNALVSNAFSDAKYESLRFGAILLDAGMLAYSIREVRRFEAERVRFELNNDIVKNKPKLQVHFGAKVSRYSTRWKNNLYIVGQASLKILGGVGTALGAVSAVLDVLAITKQLEYCSEQAVNIIGSRNKMQADVPKALALKTYTQGLYDNVTGEYTLMKQSLQDSEFNQFLENMTAFLFNASVVTPEYRVIAEHIIAFRRDIPNSPSDNHTGLLVETLTKAFDKITYKYLCLSEKMKALKFVRDECIKGLKSVGDIYDQDYQKSSCAREQQGGQPYIGKSAVVDWVRKEMVNLGKQTDCILNNENKRRIVCGAWARRILPATIQRDNGINPAQYHYFTVTRPCPPADLGSSEKTNICVEKGIIPDKLLSTIKQAMDRFNASQIDAHYQACSLTAGRTSIICADKFDIDYTLDETVADHPTYPRSIIKAAYDACVLAITDSDKRRICTFKSRGYPFPSHSRWQSYITKYGEPEVRKAYDACTSGDSPPSIDHNRRLFDALKMYENAIYNDDDDDDDDDDDRMYDFSQHNNDDDSEDKLSWL